MKADYKSEPTSFGRGIQIFIAGKHVKTIAKGYALVWNTDFIEDTSKKRVTKSEKKKLDKFLKDKKLELKKEARKTREKNLIKSFLSKLAQKEPRVHELVKNSKPKEARHVQNYYQETWKELVFENKMRVKIPSTLFNRLNELKTNVIAYVN